MICELFVEVFGFLLPVCIVVVCVGSAVLLDFVVCLCFVGDQDWQMV